MGLDADGREDYPLDVSALALALLSVVLTAPRASAAEAEAGVRAQKAREIVESLPVEARVELKRMYRRYKDVVTRKMDEGWHTGVLSEAVIEDIDEPFQPTRLVLIMLEVRKKEAAKIEAALKALDPDDPYNTNKLKDKLFKKRAEVSRLISRSKREKGLCRDWSDLIWSEFISMELEHWNVRDERREARPYHTAAVACYPSDSPVVCLAFDPWEDGRPSVFAYQVWDERAPGGRFPAEFFLHGLPDKVEPKQ